MKIFKKLLIIYTFLFISIYSLSYSKSENNGNQDNSYSKPLMRDLREVKSDIKNESSERKANILPINKTEGKSNVSCANSKVMMEKRISLLQSNIERRTSLLDKTTTFLDSKISLINANGTDTSEISANIELYKNATNSLIESRSELLSELVKLSEVNCEENTQNFKQDLREFNQKFKNQNLEFNKVNRDFRVNVLYKLNNSLQSLNNSDISSNE